MIVCAVARSISRPVREQLHRLQKSQSDVRVLAVFERACDLVTRDGKVIALVLTSIGDGPLNVVVDGAVGLFAGIDLGAPVTLRGEQLWIGGLRIDLGEAAVWEPRPDWDTLRTRRSTIVSHLPLLRALCLRHTPVNSSSLLALLEAPPPEGNAASTKAILSTAQEATEALREGWEGDGERLREGAARLAGLGSGLTPAGDDFLTGVMLQAWLFHPTPSSLCQTLVEVAAPRTTTLSAAFLRAAARGECSAPWHALLEGLDEKNGAKLRKAGEGILIHGATSGADSLAGFLIELEAQSA